MKENLYERLFGKGQGVEVRLHPEGGQIHGSLVQNKKRGIGGRGKKATGIEEPSVPAGDGVTGDREDHNRHGLFGIGK